MTNLTMEERERCKMELLHVVFPNQSQYAAALAVDAISWALPEENSDTVFWRFASFVALTNPAARFGSWHGVPATVPGDGNVLLLDVDGRARELLVVLMGG